MSAEADDDVADELDRRLIAALQCDGRVSAERAAAVLGLTARVAGRRLTALLDDGVRVVAAPPTPRPDGTMLLRIRVLRGKLDAVVAALAAREDIALIDVAAGGDQLIAVMVPDAGHGGRLVFRRLPATAAVTSVEAETVLHVFAAAGDWRLDALTAAERRALTPGVAARPRGQDARGPDELDARLIAALAADARVPAAAVARAAGQPESTVRRRLAALFGDGRLRTRVLIDPRRLGLPVDASLTMSVPPARLDRVGRALAAHPAVHGALATTGPGNLTIAVWLRDLDALYRFITRDLGRHGVGDIDTVLIGRAVKRPQAW
jgi:DNA-binding Lrp family transcriptional regulator